MRVGERTLLAKGKKSSNRNCHTLKRIAETRTFPQLSTTWYFVVVFCTFLFFFPCFFCIPFCLSFLMCFLVLFCPRYYLVSFAAHQLVIVSTIFNVFERRLKVWCSHKLVIRIETNPNVHDMNSQKSIVFSHRFRHIPRSYWFGTKERTARRGLRLTLLWPNEDYMSVTACYNLIEMNNPDEEHIYTPCIQTCTRLNVGHTMKGPCGSCTALLSGKRCRSRRKGKRAVAVVAKRAYSLVANGSCGASGCCQALKVYFNESEWFFLGNHVEFCVYIYIYVRYNQCR